MKQKDIALILIIAIISGMVSFFVARFLFLKPADRQLQAEVVSPITTDFNRPSDKYFNKDSINPTQQIIIGDSANTAPFDRR